MKKESGNIRIGPGFNNDQSISIGQNVRIANKVRIKGDTTIGDRVRIGTESFLTKSKIANDVKIGDRVLVGPKTFMRDYVKIGDNSILEMNIIIESNAKIGNKVYIGHHSAVRSNATIGDFAIVYPWVEIPDNTVVQRNQIVIHVPILNEGHHLCDATVNRSDPKYVEFASHKCTLCNTNSNSRHFQCENCSQKIQWHVSSSIKTWKLPKISFISLFKALIPNSMIWWIGWSTCNWACWIYCVPLNLRQRNLITIRTS